MGLNLPPLATLRIFEAAARLGSFKLAAGELGLTPSAVSHGIDTLERWLQVKLFERHGRAIALSASGRLLLPYVSQGLSMVAVGAQRIAAGPDRQRVAISAAPSFAASWLVPRLGRFRERHPRISVAIDTSHRQALFPLDGVDIAIRRGRGPWPGTTSHLLFAETLVPVGTPEYLEQVRKRGHIDWGRVTFLRLTSVEQDWSTWLEGAGLAAPDDGLEIGFDTINLALDAAAAGLGLALARKPLLAAHPAASRLEPAGKSIAIDSGYWLTMPSGDEPRREIRAFQSWLLAEVASMTGR